MTAINYWYWLLMLLIISMPIPIGKILRKTGRSPWWALLYFIPIFNILALWVWAFGRGPRMEKTD